MVSCEPAMEEGTRGKEKKYIPSCGHDLELAESDGVDEVVVVKQQLLPDGFQPGKVNHCTA
jgi:hypothetical protein